jgi:hypothetical protein
MNLPRIQPIAPKRIQAPFDHREFAFELKMDGWRCMTYIENGDAMEEVRDNVGEKGPGEKAGDVVVPIHLSPPHQLELFRLGDLRVYARSLAAF